MLNITSFDHHKFGHVWISVHDDITERMEADTRLKQNQKLMQDIIDSSPFLVYSLDMDGRFILAIKRIFPLILNLLN
jgi:PAS domain-containing protein